MLVAVGTSELEQVDRLRFLNRASIEFGLELDDLWRVEDICGCWQPLGDGCGNKNDENEKVIELRLAL